MENPATKIFKSNVNFVYDELIKQFINNKGNCLESTFCLINWGYILDSNNNEGYNSKHIISTRLIIFLIIRIKRITRWENSLQIVYFIFNWPSIKILKI